MPDFLSNHRKDKHTMTLPLLPAVNGQHLEINCDTAFLTLTYNIQSMFINSLNDNNSAFDRYTYIL